MESKNKIFQKNFDELKKHLLTDISSFLEDEYIKNFPSSKTKNISKKFIDMIQQVIINLENWIQEDIPDNYKELVLQYIVKENWEELIEAFKQDLVFGTSGVRGKLTVSLDNKSSDIDLHSLNDFGFNSTILRGSNSFNEITLLKNIFGLINYMKKNQQFKIVIGCDSRVGSKLYSRLITYIFLQNNFSVILFEDYSTLPELSFAVTHFSADMGIEITASHNDKRYNGYKLISHLGSPPTPEIRDKIHQEIFNNDNKIFYDSLLSNFQNDFDTNIKLKLLSKNTSNESEKSLSTDFYNQYLNQITNSLFNKNHIKKYASEIVIGYSAIHGTGNYSVSKLMRTLGVTNIKYISKMISPDPYFSSFTSKQILDPSDNDAANVVVNEFKNQYTEEEFSQLDFLCYTDPDSDRLGIVVNVSKDEQSLYGKWKLMKANDVWSLFLWYFLENISNNTTDHFSNLTNLFIVKSFVTSDILSYISKKFNVECIDGKVGFSDLTEIVRKKWNENKINLGMFEESCGFGMSGNPKISSNMHILEKDGILSLAFIIEILAYAKSKNLSLLQLLDKIYLDTDIGFFTTHRNELPEKEVFEGIKGEFYLEKILNNVENFYVKANAKIAEQDPLLICDLPITNVIKYATGRYDEKFWKDFPDEGIRFFLGSKTDHITIRFSGTEPKIRIFVQIRVIGITKENLLEKKFYAENLAKNISKEIEKLISNF